ncbi:hypothetical protein CAPTEDRAFT_229112 [Capitella teleta]|uniref:Uncharacterized protein n=1 Tax=Capitella teleta TaxID=283909 RepID=R7U903_CAPTE|nr:hypothetical protein CAPTEDRAFT_229112 [Capitella teleta]|eukprot:ELU02621.1 hypothetical protein CAPTEDRAFT_229112 [Capitella teleta]
MANSVLPPAGTSSLQLHKMPNAVCVVPDHQTGVDFLASSHFTISQDPTSTDQSMKSIFRKDYIPWKVEKPHASVPPNPSDVLLKDARYFNQRESETKNAYNYQFLEKPVLRDVSEQLRQTNFKMDKDPSFKCFSTSHNIDYTPKELSGNSGQKPNPMKSYIPQGDPDKALDPVSDYKDRFRGHDVCSNKVEKATGVIPGASTIQGDDRQRNFITSHVDAYRGNTLPKIDAVKKPTGTNIPLGDPVQVNDMTTVQQMSYQPYGADQMNPYNKAAVMGKLQETNYKQTDGRNKWSNYVSTMADSYRPVDGGPRQPITTQRNHSKIPVGDENQFRNMDRANMTSNRFHYGNPAPMVKPEIISGKDRRTESNVLFGKPELGSEYYETTTASTFQPVSAPYTYKRSDSNNTRSAVPLKYYGDQINGTTYMGDFPNPESGAMHINECAIDRLKNSHIKAPLGKQMEFSTEHLDQFTDKDGKGRLQVDAGRLQKSSVPLGTLYTY